LAICGKVRAGIDAACAVFLYAVCSVLNVEIRMRTTLNIDDYLLRDLLQATQAKTKTEAVKTAVIEYLRAKRKEKILSMRGKINITENWKQLRQLELTESHDPDHA